jgi:hypothetical protein
MTAANAPAERVCGKCNLCCKILIIPALGKPDNVWCEHCEIGKGCRIYPDRPAMCRDFKCGYLRDPSLGEEWYPAKCHFVLRSDNNQLVVQVDHQRPDAWKREPYHAAFQTMARNLYPRGGQIIVKVGARAIVVLPDRDVDLGLCEEGDRFTCTPEFTPSGVRWNAAKIAKAQ